MHATFSLHGEVFMCIDSAMKHEFSFTPAVSFYVTQHAMGKKDQSMSCSGLDVLVRCAPVGQSSSRPSASAAKLWATGR